MSYNSQFSEQATETKNYLEQNINSAENEKHHLILEATLDFP